MNRSGECDVAEREHERAGAYNRRLIEASLDPLVTIDTGGKITDLNAATERVTGYSRRELIGTDFSDYFTQPEKAREGYRRVFRDGWVQDYELEIRARDGRLTPVLYNASVYRDEAGEIAGVFAAARDISERKRVERELRRAGAYNRSLIDASLDPLVTIAADGQITDVNRATEEATGCSREELIGTDFSEYFTDRQKARAGYQQVFREGAVQDYELEMRHRSGRLTPVVYNASLYRGEDGSVAGVFAAARDISERKRAEHASAYLAAIVDSSEDAIVGKSLEGTIVSWNAGAEKLYGYTAEDVIGRPVSILTPADRLDEAPTLLKRIAAGERVEHYETVRLRKDGQPIEVAVTVSPIRNREGVVAGASAIARDITEHKRAERAVRRASAYNRSLIEASLDPLVTIDSGGKVTDVNTATEKVTGYSRQELIGTDFSDYFTQPERARAGYQQVFRDGWVQDYELEIRHRDGRLRPVLYNASVYRDEAGNIVGVFAAARDMAERKRAEEALRESLEEIHDLYNRAPCGYHSLDRAGVFLRINDTELEWLGYAREEVIGNMHFADLLTGETRPAFEQSFQQFQATGLVRDLYLELVRRDRTILPMLLSATGTRDREGHYVMSRSTVYDITERRRAENEVQKLNQELEQRVIQRTAQLEAANREMEAFSYSVSHDLRAPLRAIHGFSGILLEEYAPQLDPELQHYLQVIRQNAMQMGALIDDLLAFCRLGRQGLRTQAVAPGTLAGEALETLQGELEGRQVEVVMGELPQCQADPTLLRQVFVNLLSNALKYTRLRKAARIEVGALAGRGAPVYFVRDNGVGFDMQYADKLFGVFQRLHPPGEYEGTGVGLATVQRIVDRHGGRIWAEAECDRGATFYFTIGETPQGRVESVAHGDGTSSALESERS